LCKSPSVPCSFTTINLPLPLNMTTSTAVSWTIVHQEDTSDHASDIQSLRNALEKGNEDTKIQTMQKILVIMLNGDPLPGLLMHVIRFVVPSLNRTNVGDAK